MSFEIHHDEARRKFISVVEDAGEAYLAYDEAGPGTVDFRSTFVPPAGRGTGLGAELVKRGLDWAIEQGTRVVPSCSFVAAYIDAHPRYEKLRA